MAEWVPDYPWEPASVYCDPWHDECGARRCLDVHRWAAGVGILRVVPHALDRRRSAYSKPSHHHGVVYGLSHILLTKTQFGRYVYAIGGNEEAAILSGINVRRVKLLVYGQCGMLSGLAAVLLTARLNSAQPIAGVMYELDAIAATVIGGTSLLGGEGAILGTLIGALIIGVLRNGLNLLGTPSFTQQVVIGSVIIISVLLDMGLRKRQK